MRWSWTWIPSTAILSVLGFGVSGKGVAVTSSEDFERFVTALRTKAKELSERALRRIKTPSASEVLGAREAFNALESRGRSYWIALDEVDRGYPEALAVASGLGIMLRAWNHQFYRFRGGWTEAQAKELAAAISKNLTTIDSFRRRELVGISARDELPILNLFVAIEKAAGPVGAAKSLHLLAPNFFPLWDRGIATAYGLPVSETGYLAMCMTTCSQLRELSPSSAVDLKMLDEYNYAKFTRAWSL